MGFGVVINNSLSVMRLMLIILGLAKLPMYGLHMWLPKVHVEASMVGSIVLARAVLKLGILYCWNFGGLMLIRLLLLMSVVVIIVVIDRKGFAAYSSVLHISICVIFGLIVIILVGYIHIILSPLIFMTVYKIYSCSGSRLYLKSGLLMMILWLVNFGLPFVGSFFSEVYMMQYVRLMLVILVVMYIMVGYVAMKSLNIDRKGLFYIPFLVLYILMI
jgi:NADH-ubiquinone oxidoreductase chain 4